MFSAKAIAMYKEKLSDGFCVELDAFGEIIQAHGFGNRDLTNGELLELGHAVHDIFDIGEAYHVEMERIHDGLGSR